MHHLSKFPWSSRLFFSLALIFLLFTDAKGITESSSQSFVADSIPPYEFSFDFLFRTEQDWDSRKSDGTYRDDRFRLRYRFRVGAEINLGSGFEIGTRVRTGTLEDQQGSPVTIGQNGTEFEPVRIVMDKLYIKFSRERFWAWLGKNSFPSWTQNELFWGSNVIPDGMATGYLISKKSNYSLEGRLSYLLTSAEGPALSDDHYLITMSALLSLDQSNSSGIFQPAFYYFNELPDIPDGQENFTIPFRLLQFNGTYTLNKETGLKIGADLMFNLSDYSDHPNIAEELQDQKLGLALAITYGHLNVAGDFQVSVHLTHLEKYAVVDYFAQNDWGRWDYKSEGSDAARLSNFKGIKTRLSYRITNRVQIRGMLYFIEQLVSTGATTETGSRFRLELIAKF